MKKFIILFVVVLAIVVCLVACGGNTETTTTSKVETTNTTNVETTITTTATETTVVETTQAIPGAGTPYSEYDTKALEEACEVISYVQAKQSWWDNKATLYLQSNDGAYFVYNAQCSQELFDKLVPGTKVKITGVKSAWSGEVEIVDGQIEILSDSTYIATPTDVTALLPNQDELIKQQNKLVSFKGLTIVASKDGEGIEHAFMYKYNNSGSRGDDLYFKVSDGTNVYTFTVESYLCGAETEVYKTVEGLKIGDVVDLEGFLYWYNGVNPHITKAVVKGVGSSYAEYDAKALEEACEVVSYVQAKQSWWDNKATLYLQSNDGAYFVYNAQCSQELFDKLVPGTKVKITGVKSAWSGEVEIVDGQIEILTDETYIAPATDVTALLSNQDELIKQQNKFVSFKDLTIVASKDGDGTELAFMYKYNNSGSRGDDLYFKVSDGTNVYTFTVESYLCGADTEVYKTVEGLKIGDKVDLEGFLYWYNGVNPHITSVVVK